MRTIKTDLWDGAWRPWVSTVICTNIGWTKAGLNPMGRGQALAAAQRFPGLSAWYGDFCMVHGEVTPVVMHRFKGSKYAANIIFFPTKPLNHEAPQLSWRQPSDPKLIRRALFELHELGLSLPLSGTHVTFSPEVHIGAPGCGQGGLRRELVLPMMKEILVEDRFVFVG